SKEFCLVLQTMRSSAKFVFWILAVAFIGAFMFSQTSGLIGSSPVTNTTAVAKVNGKEILYADWQRRAQQSIQQTQQQSGRSLTQDETRRIENQAFDEMVSELLLAQEYDKRGIVVSDEELRDYARFAPPPWIRNAPDLMTDGRFDPAKYQRLLGSAQARQSGLLVAIEQYFRSEIPREKLFEQVTAGLYVTDNELWRAWQDANDSASVSFVVFRSPSAAADSNISDSDLHAYYDAHKNEFDRPGRAVLSVLHVPRVVTAADTAATLKKIAALRAEIAGGAKFEDVAKRESADSVSGANGGDLGKGVKGRFVPEFEKAMADLKPGELSQPVKTQFGYHLIKIDSKVGDSISVRHILLKVQQSDSSATAVDREADQLAKLVAGADQAHKFDEAAKTMNLKPFPASALENQPAQVNGKVIPSVSAWAFGGAKVGETSDLFDGEDGYYVARLDSLNEGGKSFDASKSEVRAQVASDRAVERAIPAAQAFAKAAQASSLESAAKSSNLKIENTGMATRAGMVPSFGSLREAIGAAFVAPLNEVTAPIRQVDGVFVMRTDARKPADKNTFETQKKDLRQRRLQQLRQQRLQMYLDDLRKAAAVKDLRKDINARVRRQAVAS
ncbi:MAG: PpiC-type peptidyl-prolyl cis-trans isomerase, partial [Gemmatimonadetes bacterium]|nr:PpiC-type peptidyl-prolyl cis-trans isomerase [Gemmatimonadota bacterium]